MRPYGMKRISELEYPDVADIQILGLKSSAGQLRKKSGDFCGYVSSSAKHYVRRTQKRSARRDGREQAKITD